MLFVAEGPGSYDAVLGDGLKQGGYRVVEAANPPAASAAVGRIISSTPCAGPLDARHAAEAVVRAARRSHPGRPGGADGGSRSAQRRSAAMHQSRPRRRRTPRLTARQITTIVGWRRREQPLEVATGHAYYRENTSGKHPLPGDPDPH